MNADRLAPFYRWFEYVAFGRALERCRFTQLESLGEERRVLIFGEGDGRFLERLVKQAPNALIDAFESSGEMIALAAGRLSEMERIRVRFYAQNAVESQFQEDCYDLVVTNFFLDCLTSDEAQALVEKVTAALKPGGCWIIGEFAKPAGGFGRLHAAVWLRAMYLFFRVTTGLRVAEVPGYQKMLNAAGFAVVKEQRQRCWV